MGKPLGAASVYDTLRERRENRTASPIPHAQCPMPKSKIKHYL
ncbi:MAG: hypothetical protein ACRAVC_06165 [Trichormus sp.]